MSEAFGSKTCDGAWMPRPEAAKRAGLSGSTLHRWSVEKKIESRGLYPCLVDLREVCAYLDRSRGGLRDRRLYLGFSQTTLGDLAGLRQPQVSAIERGERIPTGEEQARLSKALGIDVAALLPGVKEAS